MGIGKVVGGLGKAVLGGAHKAQGFVGGTIPVAGVEAAAWTGRAINKATKGAAGKAVNSTGRTIGKSLIKKEDKGFLNGYTGYKASGLTNTLSTVGAVGVVGAVTAFSGAATGVGVEGLPGLEGVQTRAQKVGEVSYGGAPTIMSADGVGTSTQAPNLGATGDLVFGLHNGRKG